MAVGGKEALPEKEVDVISYGVESSIDKSMYDLEKIEKT